MNYKVVKSTMNTNKEGLTVYDFKIKLPKKYWHLTPQEIDHINAYCIEPLEPIMLKKEKRTVFLVGFEINKRKINKEKVIEKSKRMFWKALKKYRDDENANTNK